MPNKVVIEDNELLKLIAAGYASAYTIFKFIKKKNDNDKDKNKQLPSIAYKNIDSRILKLAQAGSIELVDNYSIHARKDYRVTAKGLQKLILPNANMIQREYVRALADHVNKFYSETTDKDKDKDKHILAQLLIDRFVESANLLNEYLRYIGHHELVPIKEDQMSDFITNLKHLKMYSKEVKAPLLDSVLVSDRDRVIKQDKAQTQATPKHVVDEVLLPSLKSKPRKN